MRLLPEGITELDPNIRWAIEVRLQLIEEAVCGPPASGTRRTRHGRGVGTHAPGRGAEG